MSTQNTARITPARNPLIAPSQAIMEAIEQESGVKGSKPITTLAYTAIDRIAPQKEAIVEALLIYADTDTLCYRSENSELRQRQQEQWDVVLGWASLRLGVKWQVGEGVMPLEQPPALHKALKDYLERQDEWVLAAFSVLAAGFSSLVLAMTVVENHLTAARAFALSRLEEDYSVEKWGADEETTRRTERLKAEMLDAGRFLKLLEN